MFRNAVLALVLLLAAAVLIPTVVTMGRALFRYLRSTTKALEDEVGKDEQGSPKKESKPRVK